MHNPDSGSIEKETVRTIEISVIIPAFNAEAFLPKCLSSLKEQSFKDFEVILVDDGSQDNTSHVAEEFLNNSSLSFTVIRQNNSGEGAARNAGIRHSRGKYLFFLDSDDYLNPDCLDKLFQSLQGEFDFSFCGFRKVSESGQTIGVCIEDDSKLPSSHECVSLIELLLKKRLAIPMWCGLYKQEILKKNNILFRENCRFAADQDFLLRYLLFCKQFSYVNDDLYVYLQNMQSVTNKINWTIFDATEMWKELAKFYEIKNAPPKIIDLVLNYRLPLSIAVGVVKLAEAKANQDKLIDLIKKPEIREILSRPKTVGYRFRDTLYLCYSRLLLVFPRLSIIGLRFFKAIFDFSH